jgi:hypothetical protein
LCRFIPGWQNALRFRPEDKMSLLPGETMPFEYGRKRKSPIVRIKLGSKSNGSHPKHSVPKKKKSKKQAF